MEKHKPYRCEVCGKRYKNLNGLKYHKNHSVVCDTDLPQSQRPEGSSSTANESTLSAVRGMDIDREMDM